MLIIYSCYMVRANLLCLFKSHFKAVYGIRYAFGEYAVSVEVTRFGR